MTKPDTNRNNPLPISKGLFAGSIRRKLLLVLVIVLTVPMSIGIIHAVRTFREYAEEQAHEKIASDLTRLLMIYENRIEQVGSLTKSIAMDNAVRVTASLGRESLLGLQLGEYLSKFLKNDLIDLVIVADQHAHVIARGGSVELNIDDLYEDGLLKRVLGGESSLGLYEVPKADLSGKDACPGTNSPTGNREAEQRSVILAVYPVNYKGEIVGVVAAGCFLNGNTSLKEEMEGKSETDFALLLGNHIILTNMQDWFDSSINSSSFSLPSAGVRGQEDLRCDKITLGTRSYLYHSLSIHDIEGSKTGLLAVFKDVNTIEAIIAETMRGMALIMVLGLVLALLSVVVVGYHFTGPLKKLVRRTETIAKGDLSSPIEVKSNDEIGILSVSFNRMIEALKESQQELIAARDYTDNIIRSMNDALIVVLPDSVIQTVNVAACDLLGYKESELVGRSITTVFEPGTLISKGASPQDLMTRNRISNIELDCLSKDGRNIPVLLSGSVMCSEDNEVLGVVYVGLDITERKRAEKALQDSEEKYRTLIETSSDAIMSLDQKGFLSCNSATLKIFGCASRDEFLQKHPSEFSPSEQPPGDDSKTLADQNITIALKNGSHQFEWIHKKLDGTEFPADVLLNAMEFGGKKILQAVVRDITERKKVEEALRDSEGKLNAMIQSMTDHISMLDQELNIIWANDVAKRKFGDDIVGMKCYEAYHKRNRPCEPYPCITLKAFQDSNIHEHYTETVDRNGDVLLFHCTANVALRDSEGNNTAVMEVSRDITEHRRAEQLIKDSLREKEVLLKEIHHRVKNNLQIITSLLNLQSRSITDEKALAMFQDSQSRVKSMALIHEKLYQASDLARIDFAEYTRNLTTYLAHSFGAGTRQIKLIINIDNIRLGVDTAVPCGLIVNELVSNAYKHAFPEGRDGEIIISFQEFGDSEFTLTIRDNGIGFPNNIDIKNTNSLGLQLVNTLSNQLGGTITLEVDGGGTTFVVRFGTPQVKGDKQRVCQTQEC